jgi:hypothetical protein
MLCVYGVIYTPGRVSWEGNFNNYKANDEGTPSMYDASGNGFVKGSVICGSFVTNKQNFQVYYDAGLSNDLPLTNVPRNSPLRQSPATVWLRK